MKFLSIFSVVLGIFGLIGVRMVEDSVFYDPFLDYFHAADKNAPFPDFEWAKLILNYIFRFSLNLLLSTLIVHFIFKNRINYNLTFLISLYFSDFKDFPRSVRQPSKMNNDVNRFRNLFSYRVDGKVCRL